MLYYRGLVVRRVVDANVIDGFSCSTMMVDRELPVRPSESVITMKNICIIVFYSLLQVDLKSNQSFAIFKNKNRSWQLRKRIKFKVDINVFIRHIKCSFLPGQTLEMACDEIDLRCMTDGDDTAHEGCF